MSKTFEEVVGEEIDGLWRGALFLTAGEDTEARALLLAALRASFHAHAEGTPSGPVGPWLQGRLVRHHLGYTGRDEGEEWGRRERTSPGRHRLRTVLQGVPAGARGALWLVVILRWSYADAADALGVQVEELGGLLAHRDTLGRALEGERAEEGRTG